MMLEMKSLTMDSKKLLQGDKMKNLTPDCSHDTRVFVNTLSSAPHALGFLALDKRGKTWPGKRVAEEPFF